MSVELSILYIEQAARLQLHIMPGTWALHGCMSRATRASYLEYASHNYDDAG